MMSNRTRSKDERACSWLCGRERFRDPNAAGGDSELIIPINPHQRFRVSASNGGPLGARVVVAPLSDGSLTCGTAALWGAGLGALLPCDRCAVHTSCCVVFAVNCDKLNRLLALMTF